ncbi:hypothetical protein [Streptomyces sp. NPDC048106]|uniref:hypothetical protein n=1 Tax=Streptomyces sp. NPDC048106 TaxID=3155750 RepID=UPI00345547C3
MSRTQPPARPPRSADEPAESQSALGGTALTDVPATPGDLPPGARKARHRDAFDGAARAQTPQGAFA